MEDGLTMENGMDDGASLDHELVRELSREVDVRLHAEKDIRRYEQLPELGGVAERQYARKLTAEVIREYADERIAGGHAPLDVKAEERLAEAVHDSMFAAGALQALLDDETIENININGYDEVWVNLKRTD